MQSVQTVNGGIHSFYCQVVGAKRSAGNTRQAHTECLKQKLVQTIYLLSLAHA